MGHIYSGTKPDVPMATSTPTGAEILQKLEEATAAAFAFARASLVTAEVARTDDDEWTRIPAPKAKCPVSKWSRSTILRYVAEKKIRSKRTRGGRFYALKDVRELLACARAAGGRAIPPGAGAGITLGAGSATRDQGR